MCQDIQQCHYKTEKNKLASKHTVNNTGFKMKRKSVKCLQLDLRDTLLVRNYYHRPLLIVEYCSFTEIIYRFTIVTSNWDRFGELVEQLVDNKLCCCGVFVITKVLLCPHLMCWQSLQSNRLPLSSLLFTVYWFWARCTCKLIAAHCCEVKIY